MNSAVGSVRTVERRSLHRRCAPLPDVIAANLATYGHPTSTVPMGGATDPAAVVDSVGAVRGAQKLRVVDASTAGPTRDDDRAAAGQHDLPLCKLSLPDGRIS